MNWEEEIVKMVFIKQALVKADEGGIWPHHHPKVAADRNKLRAVERNLGFVLDPKLSDFLLMADGWDGFYQSVDLFGTSDLAGGQRLAEANDLIDAIESNILTEVGFQKQELLPIAASPVERDFFCMGKPGSKAPGSVVWFAGGVIDEFPDFEEYFLAMMDYNRAEVVALSQ